MRSTYLCLLIVIAIITVLGSAAIVAASRGNTPDAIGWSVAIAAFVVFVLVTSFFEIPTNKMIVSFFVQTYQEAYCSGTFIGDTDITGRTMAERGGCRGLFGSDYLVLLWPIWRGIKFPATTRRLRANASQVYTFENKAQSSPRIPLQADLTVQLAFSPDLEPVFRTFDLPIWTGSDLSKEQTVYYHMTTPAESLRLGTGTENVTSRKGSYEGTILEYRLMQTLESVLHEAMRTAATRFQWRGDSDIIANRGEFEHEVLLCLSEAPESAFVRGGLLNYINAGLYPSRVNARAPINHPGRLGRSLRSLDLNVTVIEPENIDAKAAQSKPMIETYNAEAEAKRIKILAKAEGRRLRTISRLTGMSVGDLMRLETMAKIDAITIYGPGVEAVLNLLGRFGGQVGGPQGQLPPPQNP